MTRFCFGLVLWVGMITNLWADGDQAPDFSMKDVQGNDFKLADVSGKVVVLDFWATWCPPCEEEIPHFVELQNAYGSKGLEIVGIALDRRVRSIKPFIQKHNVNYRILVGDSSKVVDDYGGIIGIPTTFVIDRKGKIVTKYIGYVEKEEIEEQIKKLL